MKTCPYCAEEIQDEAVKCRFCGSWLPGSEGVRSGTEPAPPPADAAVPPTAPPSAPSGPPSVAPQPAAVVGQGAEAFSHSGERYVLGYGAGFFGIWDRGVPGGPSFSFPRDDAGWQQAWARFSALEPNAVEVAALTAAPTTPATTPAPAVGTADLSRYRAGTALGRWVIGLIAATAAAAVFAIVFRATYLAQIDDVRSGRSVTIDQANAVVQRVNATSIIVLLAFITAGIVWLQWQFRGHENLRALGARNPRFSSGWAIGWWFVPLANYAMPFLTVQELYKASDPDAGPDDWPATRTGPLLGFWWAAMLAQLFLLIGSRAGGDQTTRTLSQVATDQGLAIAGYCALIVAAGLAITLVIRIDQRQETKRDRIAARLGGGVADA